MHDCRQVAAVSFGTLSCLADVSSAWSSVCAACLALRAVPHLVPRPAELLADDLHGHRVVKAGDLVAQLLQLHHGCRAEQVRPYGQRLPQLDVSRPQGCDNVAQLYRPCNLGQTHGCELPGDFQVPWCASLNIQQWRQQCRGDLAKCSR